MTAAPRLVNSLAELKSFATELRTQMGARQIVLLNGPMGAGKTQLVRYIVEAMGGRAVSSPTFAIHNEYKTAAGVVDHVDLYRLESEAELEATGFWDLFSRASGLVIVEWADRLDARVWPPSWERLTIYIEARADSSRLIRCE